MINKESGDFLVRHYLDKSFYEQLIEEILILGSRTKLVFLQLRIQKNLRIEYLIKEVSMQLPNIFKIKQYFAWIHMMELCFTIIGLK